MKILKSFILPKTPLLVLILFLLACSLGKDSKSVKVIVKLDTGDTVSRSETVFLTGNTDQLGDWMPDHFPLQRLDSNIWEGTLDVQKNELMEFKVTKGSWRNEAVDSNGVEYPNFNFLISSDTVVNIHIYNWRDTYSNYPVLSLQRMQNKGGQIEIFENWRYQKGDNPEWSAIDYDDSDWELVNSTSFREEKNLEDWHGIGWFRMHFIVDSSLWNKPLALRFFQSGASQLFLNNRLLYGIGHVSTESEETLNYLDRTPKVLTFPPKRNQVMAVRYSDHNPSWYYSRGFYLHFSEINNAIENTIATTRRFSILQSIFTVLPLTLALIHLLLFLYFRKSRENVFYALFMLSFALLSYSNFQITFTTRFFPLSFR